MQKYHYTTRLKNTKPLTTEEFINKLNSFKNETKVQKENVPKRRYKKT